MYNVPTNQNIFIPLHDNNHKNSIATKHQNSNYIISLTIYWKTILLPIATNSFIESSVALGMHKGKN